MVKIPSKIFLLIMDGWGWAPSWGGNAISIAKTPNFDALWRQYPHTLLKAAEEAVGLPIHEPGNSEVGHLNIGCGRVVQQNLPGITSLIENGEFYKNPVLIETINHTIKNNSNLHLLGLVSDGGVHSYNGHLYALLKMAKTFGVKNVFIHMISDGRDTDPMKSLTYVAELKKQIDQIGLGKIVSVMGRYWAMDRDKHWDRIKKAYDVVAGGIGPIAKSVEQAISNNYRENKLDEFITPTIIQNDNEKYLPLDENDSLIIFNYRADRARQITQAIAGNNFHKFTQKSINNLSVATFAFLEEYIGNNKIKVVFGTPEEETPLAQIISEASLKQFHIAETEKYAHVTYFFNGGKEKPFLNEDRLLVQSPKIPTFDLKPEMSAYEVTKEAIKRFSNYDFIVCNLANLDMVGHTGNIKAAVRACETVDDCIGKFVKAGLLNNVDIIITADHGNAEQMINPQNGEPYTEHTINPVPFILCSNKNEYKRPLKQSASNNLALSDIAPTILKIMGLPQIEAMSGKSLIE